MPQKSSIIGKITEELGELGKKVATETARAPVDIVTGAFEKKSSGETPSQPTQKTQTEQGMPKEKPISPRKMLEQYARKSEPSVYEKKMKEEHEKKETAKKQAAVSAWQQLPNTGHAPRRGDPGNIAKKQAHPEIGKNLHVG